MQPDWNYLPGFIAVNQHSLLNVSSKLGQYKYLMEVHHTCKQQYTNDTELFCNTENEILLLMNFLHTQIILNYLFYLHLFWYTRLY